MSKLTRIWAKICHKWAKIRLQPIQVFCSHHVCAEYDATAMNEYDWMAVDEFKRIVLAMQQNGVEFISLSNAFRHISKDWIRHKKYAVLTFDDGYASLKEILPWLKDQQISATLFINGKYLDGKSYRANQKEKYLNKDELFSLTSPWVEIGSHGWEHIDASLMSKNIFTEYINRNIQTLANHPRFIPFHAYTWGKHSQDTDKQLKDMHIIPVLVDGMKNYNNPLSIHRELLDR